MSDEEKELSDDEYAALLQDLEGRTSSQSSGASSNKAPDAGDDDLEDIDAFLANLEADDSPRSTTTTREREEDDPLFAEFAALMEKGELVAPPEPDANSSSNPDSGTEPKEKKPSRKERRAEKQEAKAAEKAARAQEKADNKAQARQNRSRGKQILLIALQWAAWLFPAFTLWWILGAFLGQWISAAWLIFLVATMTVTTLPFYLKKLARRGSYKGWLAGFSLVAVVGLLAPIPNITAKSLTEYGHWPTSMIAELSGAPPDAAYVRVHAGLSGWIAGILATTEGPSWEARQLGTVYALDHERPILDEPTTPSESDRTTSPPEENTTNTNDPGSTVQN